MSDMKLGAILKELRKSKGYSQEKVAELIDTNRGTLSSWENGVSEPSASLFLRLMQIYEIKDIYATFDNVSPKAYLTDAHRKTISQIQQMPPSEVLVVDKFIDYLEDIKINSSSDTCDSE